MRPLRLSRSCRRSLTLFLSLSSALVVALAEPASTRPLARMLASKFAKLPELRTPLLPASLNESLLAAALFHETNRARRQEGLRPLKWMAELDEAADLQANSGALDQEAGHMNLFPSLLTVADRLHRVALPDGRAAENVALLPLLDIDPAHGLRITRHGDQLIVADDVTGRIGEPHTYASFAVAAVKAWMDSAGHRANILNPDLHFVGCSGRLTKRLSSPEMIVCVQVFYTPPGSRRAP